MSVAKTYGKIRRLSPGLETFSVGMAEESGFLGPEYGDTIGSKFVLAVVSDHGRSLLDWATVMSK